MKPSARRPHPNSIASPAFTTDFSSADSPFEAHSETPSQRSSRSLPHGNFDSPFLSPPRTAVKNNTHYAQKPSVPKSHSSYRAFDSPFQSPPDMSRGGWQAPLVLDPSAKRHHGTTGPNSTSTPYSNNPLPSYAVTTAQTPTDMAQKLLQVATGRIRDQLVIQDHMGIHSTPAIQHSLETAASLARHAVKAGYLQKLGQNIPEFKRRFFVLQAETNLYYFLSPNDLEPRGKISLDGTKLEPLEQLPDGRFRFAVYDDSRRIVLEARSEELGKEWIQRMEEERVSTLKEKTNQLNSQVQSQKFQISELERQVENFKLVERDRDGALEDARQWKAQFERLDEALRLLTQRMRQPPQVTPRKPKASVEDSAHAEEKKEMDSPMEIIEVNGNRDVDKSFCQSRDQTPTKNNQSSKKTVKHPSSLLDTAFHALDENFPFHPEGVEEIMSVPGIYFSGLADACQQQRDSLRLAAEEAAAAVDDVQEAHSQLEDMKKRMDRAEKHLTRLWEENCSIRKTLKQKTREKRVLVREYKVLLQANKELEEKLSAAIAQRSSSNKPLSKSKSLGATHGIDTFVGNHGHVNGLGSDEERLIDELEAHVASSIQLHERLLAANNYLDIESDTDCELNTSMENTEGGDEFPEIDQKDRAVEDLGAKALPSEIEQNADSNPPMTPKLLSLMDDEASNDSSNDDDDSDNDEDEGDDLSINEYQSLSPSVVSSVGAEFGSVAGFSHSSAPSIPTTLSTASTPERPNPVLQLDQDDDDFELSRKSPLGVASTLSRSTLPRSVITESGQATARLSCPLADVVEPRGYSQRAEEASTDMAVYHLTFYSKKIGIQFQKAPPAPTKPKGLLTAAMTADLNGDAHGSDKTAAELRNVLTITALASGRNARNEEICPVALPRDVVLVCGFQGFDESGANSKPKLGARLVAFDGVSVEIGPWTFDSIRRAIQSRGRPLTLSFRNDYLTTEQRAVLTKAVMEVDSKRPPRTMVQFASRPPSTTPSITSALSHDTECFVNEEDGIKPSIFPSDDRDLSMWAQERDCCHGRIAAASHSVSGRLRRLSSSSQSTHQSNMRSFSEAGSSISTFAPLVATLVKQVSDRRREEAKFTPQYLMRRGESLESTPQHQDFQSNLL